MMNKYGARVSPCSTPAIIKNGLRFTIRRCDLGSDIVVPISMMIP